MKDYYDKKWFAMYLKSLDSWIEFHPEDGLELSSTMSYPNTTLVSVGVESFYIVDDLTASLRKILQITEQSNQAIIDDLLFVPVIFHVSEHYNGGYSTDIEPEWNMALDFMQYAELFAIYHKNGILE